MTDDTIETVFTIPGAFDYSNIDFRRIASPGIYRVTGVEGHVYDAMQDAWVKKPEDPKSMAVKADTQEDIDRLWRAVQDYAAS